MEDDRVTEFTDELLRNGGIRAHDGGITDMLVLLVLLAWTLSPFNMLFESCFIYVALTLRFLFVAVRFNVTKHAIPE